MCSLWPCNWIFTLKYLPFVLQLPFHLIIDGPAVSSWSSTLSTAVLTSPLPFFLCTLCSWFSLVTRQLRGAFAENKNKKQLPFCFRATLFSSEHGVIAQHVTPVMRRYCRCTKNSWQGLQSTKPQNQLSEGVSMISITAGMIIITVLLQKGAISHFVCTESDDSHTAIHNISVDSLRSAGGGEVGS